MLNAQFAANVFNMEDAVHLILLEELMEEDTDHNICGLAASHIAKNLQLGLGLAISMTPPEEDDEGPVRVREYDVESVVPRYSDIDFKSHFRMLRSTFMLHVSCVQ